MISDGRTGWEFYVYEKLIDKSDQFDTINWLG